jgi:N4-(beta-N-acetylglucosaminyl)-L-asparaginase
MSPKISRREFVKASAVAGAAAATAPLLAQGPAVVAKHGPRPLVVSSANGNKFKNGGPRTCVEEAFVRLARGEDVLAAVLAGVNIVELDPEDDSVGYGGLPNADGVVQLDASCMHGPKKQAGGVAALEGVRTPSLVASAVAERTDHHLLVGKDAQAFARRMGFKIEDDLNTDRSRALWLEWKRRLDPEHWLDPDRQAKAADRARRQMIAEGRIDPDHAYGTIHCSALSAKGEIAAATTTSGLAWKIPGRVGDSPILGAGIYVDNEVGAAGSTGRGEANLYHLSSFFIVECLRRRMAPKDAAIEALKRIRASTVEKRLLNPRGLPAFNLQFYVLDAKGEHAGAAFYAGTAGQYALCDEGGARNVPLEVMFPGKPNE